MITLHLLFTLLACAGIKDSTAENTVSCILPHSKAGYAFRPGCTATDIQSGVKYEIHYNQIGLRDREFPPFPKNTFRILFMGPSILVAPGIPQDRTPVKVLEKKLQSFNKKIEVINAASIGYKGLQNLFREDEYLAAYHPNLVIQFTTASDSIADAIDTSFAKSDLDGNFTQYDPAKFPQPPTWLPNPISNIFRKVIRTCDIYWKRMVIAKRTVKELQSKDAKPPEMIAVELKILEQMKAQALRANSRFLVLVANRNLSNNSNAGPDKIFWISKLFDIFTPDFIIPARILADGLTVRRIDNALVNTGLGTPEMALPNDYHFNEKGVEFLATLLSEQIQPYLAKEWGENTKRKKKPK